jgi:hypothetical protein
VLGPLAMLAILTDVDDGASLQEALSRR